MVRKKPWQIGKENAMLQAWMWKHHRSDPQWRRVRLGVLPTKESNRIYMTILRWADAIYLKDGAVWIVEAKLRPDLGALGQLRGYAKLFKNTLEFKNYWDWPIKKILLTAGRDLNIIQMCTEDDIIYEYFPLEEVNKVRMELMQPVI